MENVVKKDDRKCANCGSRKFEGRMDSEYNVYHFCLDCGCEEGHRRIKGKVVTHMRVRAITTTKEGVIS